MKPYSSQLSWDSFFHVREGFATRPLRLSLSDDPVTVEEAWDLFTGSQDLGRPVVLKAYQGGQAADVLWTSFIPITVISQRLVELLTAHGLTGWATYPVEVFGRKDERIPGFHGLAITGPNVEVDRSKSTIEPTFPRSAAWVRRNPVRVLPI